MTLFGRRCVITVGDRQIESDRLVNGAVVNGFRIEFKVTQSLTSKANTAEATIYNLAPSTRAKMSDQRTAAALQFIDLLAGTGGIPTALPTDRPQFSIEAGYEGSIGLIFKGYAERIEHALTLPGVTTKVNASDGSAEGKQLVNHALAPGSTPADLIKTLADSMKVAATRAIASAKKGDFNGAISNFANGLTLSGSAQAEMDKFCRGQGIDWTITNGELIMLKKLAALPGLAVFMDADHGMVGAPERVTDKKRPKTLLFKVRSLLQAGIQPGRRMELNAKELKGSFVVEKVSHSGDTAGGTFFSEAQIAEIKSL